MDVSVDMVSGARVMKYRIDNIITLGDRKVHYWKDSQIIRLCVIDFDYRFNIRVNAPYHESIDLMHKILKNHIRNYDRSNDGVSYMAGIDL